MLEEGNLKLVPPVEQSADALRREFSAIIKEAQEKVSPTAFLDKSGMLEVHGDINTAGRRELADLNQKIFDLLEREMRRVPKEKHEAFRTVYHGDKVAYLGAMLPDFPRDLFSSAESDPPDND